MNLNKPFYLSLTIISSIVSGIAQILNLFGVNIADLVPQITDAIGHEINATIAIAGVAFAIIGRWRARTAIVPLGSPSSAARLLLLVLAPLAAGMSLALVGCAAPSGAATASSASLASSSPTTTNAPTASSTPGVSWAGIQAKIDAALADVQKTSQVLAQTGIVPNGKATNAVNDASTVSAALQTTISNGGIIDPAQALKVAQSFHSSAATQNYTTLGVIGVDALVSLTKDLIAAGASENQTAMAQATLVAQTPTAIQAGLTASPASPAASNP